MIARRGHRVVDRPREVAQHPSRGELRQQLVDRCVERERPVGDEREHRRRRHRLARGCDAEQRVLAHRCAADRLVALRRHLDVVAARDERDQTRNIAALDVSGERAVKCSHHEHSRIPAVRDGRGDAVGPSLLRDRQDGGVLELPSPCLVVLVGAAGSGKTTWAEAHFPGHVVGSDAARRARWRELAVRHGLACHAVILTTTPADVRRWNRARAKRVPDAVLREQLAGAAELAEAVRAETFDAVHEVTPDAVPMLVAPSLVRGGTAEPPPLSDVPSRRLTFGLQISQFTWPGGAEGIGEHLREVARRAEGAGFDSLYVMDHFRQIPQLGPAWHDMLESWTTLAHLAAAEARCCAGRCVQPLRRAGRRSPQGRRPARSLRRRRPRSCVGLGLAPVDGARR